MSKELFKLCVRALENASDNLEVERDGVGFISGKPKYHLKDREVERL